MTPQANAKLSIRLRTNTSGSIRNPVTMKNIGMKRVLATNSNLPFAGLIVDCGVNCQAGEERAHDAG